MAKVVLPSVVSGYNLQKINDNDQAIATELNENVLYRRNPVGEPNEMHNNLDMNSNRIYNLPSPNFDHEPVTLKDINGLIFNSGNQTEARFVSFDPYEEIESENVQGAIVEVYEQVKENSVFTAPGGVPRTVQEKLGDIIDARDYGVVADGVTDDLPALNAAVAAITSQGGGTLHLPPGVIRITDTWVIGDGSDSQVSTKDHNLTIIGQGTGSHLSNDTVMQTAATEILFDGGEDSGVSVMSLEGPLHSMRLSGFTLNADSKAGVGINVNHVSDSRFDDIVTKAVTFIGWLFTTRNGFPPACVYGCANNVILNCYNVVPANVNVYGIQLTSGVSTALSLTGNPDSANNDFIGGIYFYGGSANSAGVYLSGADNNTINGTQFIPSVQPSFGYSVFFNPWVGDTRFPLENVFTSLGASDPVGGISGSLGNTFTIFQEGDGSDLPVMPYVNVFSHSGIEVVQGKRIWRTRDVSQAVLVDTANDTTSSTYVPVVPLTVTLSDVKAGAKLRINYSADVGKLTAGSANFILYVNSVAQGATRTTIPYNIELQNTSSTLVIDAPSGGTYAVGLYFRSNDGNVARVASGVLTVEELF